MGLGLLCPGQGDQTPAMLGLLDGCAPAQDALGLFAQVAGRDPLSLSGAEMQVNIVAQPLVCAYQLAVWAALAERRHPSIRRAGGHCRQRGGGRGARRQGHAAGHPDSLAHQPHGSGGRAIPRAARSRRLEATFLARAGGRIGRAHLRSGPRARGLGRPACPDHRLGRLPRRPARTGLHGSARTWSGRGPRPHGARPLSRPAVALRCGVPVARRNSPMGRRRLGGLAGRGCANAAGCSARSCSAMSAAWADRASLAAQAVLARRAAPRPSGA